MNIFFVSLGCDKNLVDSEVMLGLLDAKGYQIVDDETQADVMVINTCCFIHDAKEESIQTILDMASYNIVAGGHEFFSLLGNKYVDIVFANEEEAKAFTGKEPEEALDIIAKMCSIAIVKVGARGSLIRKGTEEVRVEAVPVAKVVDTSGAGDFFAAGFLYGLTCGYSLEKCGKIGAILSGEVIQVIGTELPDSKWEKIKEDIIMIN